MMNLKELYGPQYGYVHREEKTWPEKLLTEVHHPAPGIVPDAHGPATFEERFGPDFQTDPRPETLPLSGLPVIQNPPDFPPGFHPDIPMNPDTLMSVLTLPPSPVPMPKQTHSEFDPNTGCFLKPTYAHAYTPNAQPKAAYPELTAPANNPWDWTDPTLSCHGGERAKPKGKAKLVKAKPAAPPLSKENSFRYDRAPKAPNPKGRPQTFGPIPPRHE